MAVGRIKGFNELEPEGKRRIFFCLCPTLDSVLELLGTPHGGAPVEDVERNDVGLDDEDGADRKEPES